MMRMDASHMDFKKSIVFVVVKASITMTRSALRISSINLAQFLAFIPLVFWSMKSPIHFINTVSISSMTTILYGLVT